jgi:MFS family permease
MVGMSVLRALAQSLGLTLRVARGLGRGGTRTGRFVARGVGIARVRGGAGDVGMIRLLDLHAASCAGDTLVAIGLAGTIFFTVPVDQARGRVALYLLVTMLPFLLLAPVVGPMLDRFRHGRRYALATTMLGRAFLAYLISENLDEWALYPAAFGMLVLSRAYGVARSAAVPRLLPAGLGLSEAGARASVFGTAAGAVAAPLGLLAAGLAGPQWSLRLSTMVFVVGMVVALRLPPRTDSQPPETLPRLFQLPGHRGGRVLGGGVVVASIAGSATLRAMYGFLTLYLAFSIRSGDLPTGRQSPTTALAAVVGALGLGSFLATAVGTRMRLRRPVRLQAAVIVSTLLAAVLAAVRYSLPTVLGLCLVTALAGGLAKLAVDAAIQERIAERVRASAFAHSETLLMLAWVIGGAVGLVPFAGPVGVGAMALFLLAGAVRAVVDAVRLPGQRLRGRADAAGPGGPDAGAGGPDAGPEPSVAAGEQSDGAAPTEPPYWPGRRRPAPGPGPADRTGRTGAPSPRPAPEPATRVLAEPGGEPATLRLRDEPAGAAVAGAGSGGVEPAARPDAPAEEPGFHLYRPSGLDRTRRLDDDE